MKQWNNKEQRLSIYGKYLAPHVYTEQRGGAAVHYPAMLGSLTCKAQDSVVRL